MMDKINQKGDINVININECRILEHTGIPSSAKLMECDACHIDDIRKIKAKVAEIIEEKQCKRLEAKSAYLWPKYAGMKEPEKFNMILKLTLTIYVTALCIFSTIAYWVSIISVF